MKLLFSFIAVCLMSSPALASQDSCTAKVLARAGLIKATSQDIVRTTDDAIDSNLDRTTDRLVSEAEQKEAAIAQEILVAVRNLQQSPEEPSAPILKSLCKNNLSVQRTVAQ